MSSEAVISTANGVEITSVFTEAAAKELELKTGSADQSVIKASNVILAVD